MLINYTMQMQTIETGLDRVVSALISATAGIEKGNTDWVVRSFVYEAKAAAETLRAMIKADGISARDGTKGVAP